MSAIVQNTINNGVYSLILSEPDLREFLSGDYDYIAMDTETSSLDTLKAEIAGISLSKAEGVACYIPIGHKVGSNYRGESLGSVLDQLIDSKTVVFFNAKYDLSILQNTLSYRPKVWTDVMILTHLDDPDRKEKGLKALSKNELSFAMLNFEDLFMKGETQDITYKNPTRCVVYAASDADATLRLYNKFKYIESEFKLPVAVDRALVECIRRIEEYGGLEVNSEYVEEMYLTLSAREEILKEMILRAVGYDFVIDSPKQLGDALFGSLQIPSPGRTAKGYHMTSEKELAGLAKQYPLIEQVLSYKKIVKAKSSYFAKLRLLAKEKIKPRFSLNMFAVPTYRLAAPGGNLDVDGHTGLNFQSISNGEQRDFYGVILPSKDKGEESSISSFKEVESVPTPLNRVALQEGHYELPDHVWKTELDQEICILDNCKLCQTSCDLSGKKISRSWVRNVQVIPSVRRAFKVPKGYLLLGADYSRQELVVGANLSKEPVWLKALANNLDLHEVTAAAAFKLPNLEGLSKEERKSKRAIGKMLNFATFYGATASTLSRNSGLSLKVAEEIYRGFRERLPSLFRWMDEVQRMARKQGYVTTYFGRRRWLKQFYQENTPRMLAFANRSAVNTKIQATSSDITRIAMVKSDKYLLENQIDLDQARLVLSIHDELQWMVKESLLDTVGKGLVSQMLFHIPKWTVQLTVDVKVGEVWGMQKEYKFPT